MTEDSKKTPRVGLKKIIIPVVLLLLVILGVYLWKYYDHKSSSSTSMSLTQQASQAKAIALANARKALAKNPNDPNAISVVANLTPNKSESRQLYSRLLTIYQNDMKGSTATATSYWAEGNLAAKAGQNSQAKIYYQYAINAAAKSNSSYDKSIAQQSETAIKELQ